ncbi:uncharacterized protein LOC125026971 [Penaeus chinensis]|uniref:uncharacterized protein LOC125026971 n=1 Tax=Penaeus chinensis TaxID=139456 RepID=UPI001FB58655|nr:uncharacterized protein LOC125026971 [Penaeus chinensis]
MELQNRKCCQLKMTTWQKIARFMLMLSAATYVDAAAAGDSLEEVASEGKLHYEVIMREAKMPKYGDCYQNALEDLHNGCSNLDDEVSFLTLISFLLSLRTASEDVSSQLSRAVDSATALRNQLDSQMVASREAIKGVFAEFRETTAEQRGLIVDVFDQVSQLQSLVMGEFTWFYSVVFYVSGVLVTLVATCTPRTASARLPLLTILAFSLTLERAVTAWLLANTHIDSFQIEVHTAVWGIRRACVFVCFLSLIRALLSYRDPVAVTAARLEELASATSEIKKLMNNTPGALELTNTTLASLSQVLNDSASSDDTYEPSDASGIEDQLLDDYDFEKESGGWSTSRYSLRRRQNETKVQNPVVSMESPEAFGRTVRRMENISMHRSRVQARRLSKSTQQASVTKISDISYGHFADRTKDSGIESLSG